MANLNPPENIPRPELNPLVDQLTQELSFVNEYNQTIDVTDYERPEQVLNLKFIPRNGRVLELGGRYGVVSCFINRVLENKQNHVIIEPDITVLNALRHNKTKNGAQFKIFTGLISKQKMSLIPAGSATRSRLDESSLIENVTYKEIEDKYGLDFDCLIVDCEGFFEQFLSEFGQDLGNIKYLFLEYDFPQYCNYQKVDSQLQEMGFRLEYEQYSHWHGLVCWHKIWIR